MAKNVQAFLREHGFTVNEIDRESLIAEFDREVERSLAGERSSLRMLPSSLSVGGKVLKDVPALVVDAGGTNLRVGVVTIPSDGSGPRIEHLVRRPMPGTYGCLTADEFHGAIGAVVDEVAAKVPRVDCLGYCFSYACESTPDHDAKLIIWSKNVEAPEVVGQCVGVELKRRVSQPLSRVMVLNDTVATLLAGRSVGSSSSDAAYVGFILGTGTNTAAVEKGEVRNAESGDFDKIVRSEFDLAFDRTTYDPGVGVFEKMISGAYLGPLGLSILRSAAQSGVFAPKTAAALDQCVSLDTRDFDAFASEVTFKLSDDGISESTGEGTSRSAGEGTSLSAGGRGLGLAGEFDTVDLAPAREIALSVFRRAAVLTAVHLAAFIRRQPAKHVILTIDGSTYYKTRSISFDTLVRTELSSLVASTGHTFEIVRIPEAPMVGAAIAALTQD